jgi:hypothetical protein
MCCCPGWACKMHMECATHWWNRDPGSDPLLLPVACLPFLPPPGGADQAFSSAYTAAVNNKDTDSLDNIMHHLAPRAHALLVMAGACVGCSMVVYSPPANLPDRCRCHLPDDLPAPLPTYCSWLRVASLREDLLSHLYGSQLCAAAAAAAVLTLQVTTSDN